MLDTDDVRMRREIIRQLLRTQKVGTQEELGELLARKGYEVTQATLSRDLAKLRARRVTLPEGGVYYELESLPIAGAHEQAMASVLHLVSGVDFNEMVVVVTTLPGAAPAVARGLDEARLPSVLGTLAGDDTIFVAPARKTSAQTLAKQLQKLWRRRLS